MMRRRGITSRWNAAAEAARRWRLALPNRAEEPGESSREKPPSPETRDEKPDAKPKRERKKAG